MITEQLIWFIDCRFYYQTTSLDKIVRIASIHKKPIKVIIDASAQLKGRGYWYLLNNKDTLSKELIETIDKKQTQLLKFFAMNAIKAEVIINKSADYLTALNAEINNKSNHLVVIEETAVAKRHPIFQKLTDINAPVLLLNKKAWKNPINILAAIDPLHENARPGTIDKNIASLAENWSGVLNAKWVIVHCCHLASVLAKYKNKVLSIHREGLDSFAKNNRIPLEKCILLEGTPEFALASYINQQHIDLMVIGLVARNKLEQMWIGSTTTALLSELPCDMLLIKQ